MLTMESAVTRGQEFEGRNGSLRSGGVVLAVGLESLGSGTEDGVWGGAHAAITAVAVAWQLCGEPTRDAA